MYNKDYNYKSEQCKVARKLETVSFLFCLENSKMWGLGLKFFSNFYRSAQNCHGRS